MARSAAVVSPLLSMRASSVSTDSVACWQARSPGWLWHQEVALAIPPTGAGQHLQGADAAAKGGLVASNKRAARAGLLDRRGQQGAG